MRRVFAVILSFVLIFSIAGCSSAGNKTDSTNTSAVSSTSGTEATSEKPAVARDVKLSVLLTYYGRLKDQFGSYFDQFAKKELAEKNINVTFDMEFPSDTTLLKTRLSSGESPDVFNMHSTLDAPLYEKGGYLPDLTNEPFVGKLTDSMRKVVTINNKVVGVPLESLVWSYVYNKGIFSKYNLTAPKTLSEMKSVIGTLKSNGVTPFQLNYKEAYFCGWGLQVPLCAMANKVDPDLFARMNKGTGSFKELVDKGLLDIFDLINANGSARPLEVGPDDGVAQFAKGNAAMMVTGPWYSENILKIDPNFQLGVAALPIDEDPSHSVVMMAVSEVLTCSPTSKEFEVAKDLVNYMLDDKDSSGFYNSAKFNQVATNQKINMYPWSVEGMSYVNAGLYYIEDPIPNSVNDALGRISQLYYSKQIDRAEFVKQMDEAWKKSVEANK